MMDRDERSSMGQKAEPAVVPIPVVENAPPQLTGGEGFSFEDAVGALYLAALLGEHPAAGLNESTIVRVAFQQGPHGHPLDDLVVTGRGADGSQMRFDAQVKRKLVISAAESNRDFRDTVLRAHQTVTDASFQLLRDRVGAVTGQIASASKHDFENLCEMARAEAQAQTFAQKIRVPDTAGQKLDHFEAVQAILRPHVPTTDLDHATHRLLSHFVLIQMDMLAEGSVLESHTISQLGRCLPDEEQAHASTLWRRLTAAVRLFQGRAAGLDRATLVASFKGSVRLRGAPSLTGAMSLLRQEAELALEEISDQIADVTIARDALVQKVRAAAAPGKFVQLTGSPGVGKSAVLRALVSQAHASGSTLFFKSDRLVGSNWAQYAQFMGLVGIDLEAMLVEIGSTGTPILFVDGIDRIEVNQRKVVLDVLNRLLASEHLRNWAVVATARDTGLEHIRTWLPSRLLAAGVFEVAVKELSDDEATILAGAVPALSAGLFGPEPLRSLMRRPFFAAILAKEASRSSDFPVSEIGLADLWWRRGGYASDQAHAHQRQNALVEMASAGAVHLGRRISMRQIDPVALAALVADGVVREVRAGHQVQFTHDIFFEWAFLQQLVAQADDWPSTVRGAGEPPALGRVVELLSQLELTQQGQGWGEHLAKLEADPTLRSQWRRSWLVGPFSLPNFDKHRSEFDQAVYADIQNRAAKLLVWFQAEKTSPYPLPLLRQELELGERLRLADLLAIPSDVGSWRRFCNWVLDSLPQLPAERFWDAFQSLSVWQNLWSGRRNRTSTRIVTAAAETLHELEALASNYQDDEELARQRWRGLGSRERKKLASMLRGLVLRAAETDTDQARTYLCNRQQTERPRVGDGDEVLLHAPFLAGPLPDELVDYSLFVWKDRLPVDAMRHCRSAYRNMFRGIEDRDWDRFGLTELARYGSAAPTREPFQALFRLAPDAGRRLVRELANHAITSWRQLHRLSARRRGTPIPLTLHFPWGEQRFWGGPQEYQWAVGQWAPKPVGSGLMALTQWAFAAVDGGDPVDEVIRQVLEGHQCVGALHVACVLAMKTTTISPTTIALFTSQRIWHWDINRWVQARRGLASNLIGFQPGEEAHAKAVQQINERETALGDIRLLTLTCHLRGGELADRSAALVCAFEHSPAFDTHEERMDSGTAASRSRTAKDWAQCGHLENYRFRETSDRRSIEVSIENPAERSEEVDAVQARYAQRVSTIPLQLWTGKYFKSGEVPDSMTIEQAVAAAKAFDRADLFSSGYSHSDANKDVQGVVAGVAAVVCAEAFESELEWATQVCISALHTPEGREDFFVASSILSNHPVQNALHGVGALLKRFEGEDARHVQVALTSFVAHPYEQVGLKALEGLLGAWERHPGIGWDALDLATELSLIDMRRVNTRDHDESDQARRERLVQAAMDRLDARHTSAEALVAIPALPVHWLPARNGQGPQRRSSRSLRTTSTSAQWLPNPLQVHINFLKDVLPLIPVDAALGAAATRELFLDWCEGLGSWTVRRACPLEGENGSQGLAGEKPEVSDFEWSLALYTLLARVSLQVSPQEAERRFVAPACAADDATFAHLLETFASMLSCAIADLTQVPASAIPLLRAVGQRLLRCGDWSDGVGYRSGSTEADPGRIVESLFFRFPRKANLASRFANADWRDVGLTLPIFEPVLRARGVDVRVAKAWLSLCEDALDYYPPTHFIEHLKHVFPARDERPEWHDTPLVAKLAGLIQRFSERSIPLQPAHASELLKALDVLVDLGDRRAAAVQMSEIFRSTRRAESAADAA